MSQIRGHSRIAAVFFSPIRPVAAAAGLL